METAFDARLVTSDAGVLLLGATDRAIGLVHQSLGVLSRWRFAELIEHEVATLVGRRVFAIAPGYEDLNEDDELRHDPMPAVPNWTRPDEDVRSLRGDRMSASG